MAQGGQMTIWVGRFVFCCNVYHHALGYKFAGVNKVQFDSVGKPVPVRQMRLGDELFFSDSTNPSGSAHGVSIWLL
ncbi:hypothetical protein AN477_02060 [Alicyclobacillus ferrooxydans]|uniref:Uncharacterized protein n=1 Tax=Alicyclobacillus ferrooxydans TaxID=471514 RepID=A0A0P9GWK7_9BACL|nr:hypothetical protein AN477_02060 [Alicyclobacillus ferrooxydans]